MKIPQRLIQRLLQKYSIQTVLLLIIFCILTQNGCETTTTFRPYTADDGYLRGATIEADLRDEDFPRLAKTDIPTNSYDSLSVPTYVTKVDDTYFIVDCYHDQVIYHTNLSDPLTQWHVMTNQLSKGHTLASDGTVYLVDDTENSRILIFEKESGVFYHTQTLDNVGIRPHYIIYDAPTDTFYAWSSMNGEMYLLRRDPADSRVYLTEVRTIDELVETYVRSFTIIDDEIYFVSGIPSSTIICADLESFRIKETYSVPSSMSGMVQLTKIDNYFYITISTDLSGKQDFATIIRVKKLSDLEKGNYEDVYSNFIGGGTPYYITKIDNSYYLTEHRLAGHSVWKFETSHGDICSVVPIY